MIKGYYYEIEMFKEDNKVMSWVKEVRIYAHKKALTDFDLYDIEGKRRNATFIKTEA